MPLTVPSILEWAWTCLLCSPDWYGSSRLLKSCPCVGDTASLLTRLTLARPGLPSHWPLNRWPKGLGGTRALWNCTCSRLSPTSQVISPTFFLNSARPLWFMTAHSQKAVAYFYSHLSKAMSCIWICLVMPLVPEWLCQSQWTSVTRVMSMISPGLERLTLTLPCSDPTLWKSRIRRSCTILGVLMDAVQRHQINHQSTSLPALDFLGLSFPLSKIWEWGSYFCAVYSEFHSQAQPRLLLCLPRLCSCSSWPRIPEVH